MFAQSLYYESKVLSRNISQLTLGELPCFHKIKMVHKTVLKINGFYWSYFVLNHWAGDQNLGVQLTVNPIQRGGGGDYAHHITAYMNVTYV